MVTIKRSKKKSEKYRIAKENSANELKDIEKLTSKNEIGGSHGDDDVAVVVAAAVAKIWITEWGC